MGKLFSSCMALAAVIAAGSLFYHFVVFLPMTHEQDMRRAEQVRVAELTRVGNKELVKVRCKTVARQAYESGREAACAEAAMLGKRRHEVCVQDALLSGGDAGAKAMCDAALVRQSDQCLIAPRSLALLEASYEKAEADCQKTASL